MMNSFERRCCFVLSAISGLRLFGLFILLPVFSIYAQGLPESAHPYLLGWAMGIYGLMQALLHIPVGNLSDRIGSLPVIKAGLCLFVFGAIIAGFSDTLIGITIGRGIQGLGAISSAVMALLTDCVSAPYQSRAMAAIGITVAAIFCLSLLLAPSLYVAIGMSGIFFLMAFLGLVALLAILWVLPASASQQQALRHHVQPMSVKKWHFIVFNPELLSLNIGVLILHAVQMAMFIMTPRLLSASGWAISQHGLLYLLVLIPAFPLAWKVMVLAEKKKKTNTCFLFAIALLSVAYMSLSLYLGLFDRADTPIMVVFLFIFFLAFNMLEAWQPTLVVRAAGAYKGLALGVYSSCQTLGIFLGASSSSWLLEHYGYQVLSIAAMLLLLLWFTIKILSIFYKGREVCHGGS